MAGTSRDFAQVAVVGTWSEGKLCPVCTGTTERLIPPLQVEWEPGSDCIGDFVWDGGFTCCVQDTVRDFLVKSKFECDFGAVVSVPNSTSQNSRMPGVELPYSGPALTWLQARNVIPLNEKRSHVKREPDCVGCGRIKTTFKSDGITVDDCDWHGEKIFRIAQNEPSDATFVTEAAKREIEEADFRNVSFKPAGVIE